MCYQTPISSTWRQNLCTFMFSREKARVSPAQNMIFVFVYMRFYPLAQENDFNFSNTIDCDFLCHFHTNVTNCFPDMIGSKNKYLVVLWLTQVQILLPPCGLYFLDIINGHYAQEGISAGNILVCTAKHQSVPHGDKTLAHSCFLGRKLEQARQKKVIFVFVYKRFSRLAQENDFNFSKSSLTLIFYVIYPQMSQNFVRILLDQTRNIRLCCGELKPRSCYNFFVCVFWILSKNLQF